MTYIEIKEMIESIGLPFTYYSFPIGEAPLLPYIVFYYPNNDDFSADNINYAPISQLNIELYTEDKDFDLEKQVESILKENGLYYDKSQTYIQQERMFEVLYVIYFFVKENDNG